jgi:hypothetical protein
MVNVLTRVATGGLVAASLVLGVAVPAQAQTSQAPAAPQVGQHVQNQSVADKVAAAARSLTPYVHREADGTFSLHVPDSVRATIESKVYDVIVASMGQVNDLIRSGDLQSTPDLRVFSTADTGFSVQGGVDKIVYYWWGYDLYLSSYGLATIQLGGSAASAYLSKLGAPGPFIATVLGLSTAILSWCNRAGNGIIWSITLAAVNWCEGQ